MRNKPLRAFTFTSKKANGVVTPAPSNSAFKILTPKKMQTSSTGSAVSSTKTEDSSQTQPEPYEDKRTELGFEIKTIVGIGGVSVAGLVVLWFVIGLTGLVPSMIDIFGVPGLRIPSGLAIGGLLTAAVCFADR